MHWSVVWIISPIHYPTQGGNTSFCGEMLVDHRDWINTYTIYSSVSEAEWIVLLQSWEEGSSANPRWPEISVGAELGSLNGTSDHQMAICLLCVKQADAFAVLSAFSCLGSRSRMRVCSPFMCHLKGKKWLFAPHTVIKWDIFVPF